ncbi:MAG: hypothetical protein HYZ47_02200 [Simkania negevensis]|nr:hypothetical protein [Simkania negevensis]
MGSGEKIITDIDATLDQLLENQKILNRISASSHLDQELSALHKMQESLLAHLLYLDSYLKEKKEKKISSSTVHEKLLLFGKMSHKLVREIEESYIPRKKGIIKSGRSYLRKRKPLKTANSLPAR